MNGTVEVQGCATICETEPSDVDDWCPPAATAPHEVNGMIEQSVIAPSLATRVLPRPGSRP